jgi:hypothetical protein
MRMVFPIPRRASLHLTCRNPHCSRADCDAWPTLATCPGCGQLLVRRWAA